jgi:hypothetical protein
MSDELLREIRDALIETNKRGERLEALQKEYKVQVGQTIQKFTFMCLLMMGAFLFLQIIF